MTHETVEITSVAGGEAKYRVRAGDDGEPAAEKEEYWADTVLLNGNEASTSTSVTIDGATTVLVDDNANTVSVELN